MKKVYTIESSFGYSYGIFLNERLAVKALEYIRRMFKDISLWVDETTCYETFKEWLTDNEVKR